MQTNQFLFRKIAIYFLLICVMPFGAKAADSNPYFIEDVAVNVTGKSPTDARNQASRTARRDALLILLTRIETPTAFASKVTDEEIVEMVRSEQIVDEKISGNNYSATFNITFARDFVELVLLRKFPNKEAKKELEEASENMPALIIPVKSLKRKMLVWEDANDWKKFMTKALKESFSNDFKIPNNDIDDMMVINSDNVFQADYTTLEPLFNKYRVSAVYIVLFSSDNVNNKANIVISYIDKFRKNQYKLNFNNSEMLDEEDLMTKVSTKTMNYLSGLKTGENKQIPTKKMVGFEVPIVNYGDWLMVKNRLEASNLISKMNVEAISRDEVKLSVAYIDTGSDIVEAFLKVGIFLTRKAENIYIVKISN